MCNEQSCKNIMGEVLARCLEAATSDFTFDIGLCKVEIRHTFWNRLQVAYGTNKKWSKCARVSARVCVCARVCPRVCVCARVVLAPHTPSSL